MAGTVAFTLAAAVAGCGSSSLLGPDADQGVEGIALIGPQCPVQSDDTPCPDLPYAATIEVVEAGGGWVTRLRTNADGRFRVGLEPGNYRLLPRSGDPFPIGSNVDVTVSAGAWSSVIVSFDTGIR
jgi:hypothetical protein